MLNITDKNNFNFKEVPNQYRPIPFWSWNEKLDTEETRRQILMMRDVGMGGFFMHARGGLQTEYMGEEWFQNIRISAEVAKENSMRPWAYDENGWPSGVGDGKVNGLGVEYQLKYLRMETENEHKDTEICKCGDHWFYYDINPFYIDALDEKVVKVFIENIYEKYYEKVGNEVEGFFTDEPEISRDGYPWSFVFEEEYQKRYDENLCEHLEELFLEIGDYKRTRLNYWRMVTNLFSSAFMKPIYDWCEKKGLKFTGHLLCENTLESQLTCNGACMPHYEYFHIPGVDWLGKELPNDLTTRQVASVAAQTGKDTVISESFALCGHSVSFDELKGIFEWQMVKGVNLMCQHLEGYSIRGIRKRDCPPAMYYQQPWWKDYGKFIEAMSRVGMILREGMEEVDVLLLHPMSSAWILYNAGSSKPIDELHDRFMEVIKELERKHIEFHLGDETMIERHGRVEGDTFVIGNCRYKTLVLPPHDILFPSTKKLVEEFRANGGKITSAVEMVENPVIDNENITYTSRVLKGRRVHYFVNTSPVSQLAVLSVSGKRIDIYSGDLCEQEKEHIFEPWGSLMILEDGGGLLEGQAIRKEYLSLEGKFPICEKTENVLVLDYCDYYFDGELQEKNGYVLNIAERANKLERAVKICQKYHVKVGYLPQSLCLVCETPGIFEISVNGQLISKEDCGYYVDSSFRKIPIAEYLVIGDNVITFDCNYEQSQQFYENLRYAHIFETERNKLTYDMEIEAVYLVGDFSVTTDGEWQPLPENIMRYSGDFVISAPATEIELADIEKQGFPFFCGSITVSKEVEIGKNTLLKMNRKGISVVTAEIDGKKCTMLSGNGEMNLSRLATEGKHTLKLTMTNTLRNLLGPHHYAKREVGEVGPDRFYKEKCIWNSGGLEKWNDDYTFIRMSIK